jgi:TonB-linked SusC/RagA family outer membrane protein
MMHKLLYSNLLLFISSLAFGQQNVRGTVTSKEDNQPIPGVNVLIQGTAQGAATDLDGKFSLDLAENQKVLIFSFVGYQTKTIEVGARSVVDVQLEMDVQSLAEIVVVGYGTQKKSDLTGAVGSVKGSDLVKIPSLNPTQSLMGKVAGVQVTSTSGAPGSSPVVRVRGVGTFNNPSPIYVVDGVILDDISFLNSSDIQSMEVLKDASSTAMYGSRGANGVILVTTKIGAKGGGASTVNFSADFSIQNLQNRIDLLSGPEFATIVNDITPGTYNNIGVVPNTDWQDLIFKSAPIQNYQFSTSGSSAKLQYYVGVGYFKQDGIIPTSNYERLTLKLNNIYHLSSKIRLGNNITLAPHQQQNTSGSAVFVAYRAQPVIATYQSDGSYSPVPGVGNVLADIEYTNSFSKSLRTVGNVYVEADLIKGLTFKSSYGVDMENTKNKNFTPVFYVSPTQQVSQNVLNKDWNDKFSWLWENTLSYYRESGKHRINSVVGYTMQNSTSENLALQGKNLTRETEDFWYINQNNIYSQQVKNEVDPGHQYSILSFLGRINYTFDERFLFTATFRRDGSSKFIKGNRYGNFPSLAVGWNIINEKFMQPYSKITNLKLRTSWGIVGNEKIDYSKQYSVVANGINAIFGTNETIVPGLTYAGAGNQNLTWESTYQTDVGLELGFFNDQFTAEVDFYNRDTKDILISLPIPGYLGNGDGARITYNAAEVVNRGIELTLGWRGKISDDIGYRIGAVGTTVHNETLKVFGLDEENDYLPGLFGGSLVTKTKKGVPIGSFSGYQVNGVFQNINELDSYPHRADAGVGDLRFVDTNGDGFLTDADRVNMGSSIPTFLYGFNMEGNYKAFELSVDFNGQSGNKIYNGKETIRPDLYNFEQHVLNRWHGEGTSTSEPRATSGGYNWLPSTRFIQNGSYIRLRSITLSYNLPTKISNKLKMKSARFYLRGTNVFTKGKFTGYTPEIASYSVDGVNTDPLLNGLDAGAYPVPSIYSAGFNVTF